MDTISRLPDEIIIHILFFLSIDEAASTSLLSKRWKDMFAFSSNLDLSLTYRLHPSDFSAHRKNFIDFVNRVLAVPLSDSGHSAIRRFALKWPLYVDLAVSNRWIRNVLKRGILDLDLDDLAAKDDSVLFNIFSCMTLVKLKLTLRCFGLTDHSEDASSSLPALKSLSLDFDLPCDLGAFEKLISSCPLLEELIIIDGIRAPASHSLSQVLS